MNAMPMQGTSFQEAPGKKFPALDLHSWREVSHINLALMPKGLLICIPGLSGIILSTVYVNKKVPINSSSKKQKESRRIMNMETEENNTVNKTVVEFSCFNHSYIDTDSLAND